MVCVRVYARAHVHVSRDTEFRLLWIPCEPVTINIRIGASIVN